MKKILTTSILTLLFTIPCMAQASPTSTSLTVAIIDFIGIALCILFVYPIYLYIKLHFKVWKMTNDVREIKDYLTRKGSVTVTDDNVRKAYLKGDMYVAQDLLTEKLLDTLLYNKRGNVYQNVDTIIAQFEPKFKNLGVEIPESILKLREDPTDILVK
jgi:hypothetical protein